MGKFYKTRRGLVPAEGLLGYVAFIVGVAGSGIVAQGSRLAQNLDMNGDSVIWGVVFMGLGAIMSLAAVLDAIARCSQSERLMSLLSRLRIEIHVLLFGAWGYGTITVMGFSEKPIIFLMLSSVFTLYHVWGAWEHTKARFLSANAKYHGLYDRVYRGGLGG